MVTQIINVPSWINSWWPELYSSLVEKEKYSLVSLQPLYDALNQYKDFNREEELALFYFRTYGYYSLVQLYDADPSYLSNIDSRFIYNLDGLAEEIISRDRDYYKLEIDVTNDVTVLQTAVQNESAHIDSVGRSVVTNMYPLNVKIMFDDVRFTGVKINKPEVGELFFETYKWKYVHNALNVGRLEKPSYIR